MNFASYLTAANTSGLFELKNDGTVLYSRFRQNNQLINATNELVGQNFFEEIAGFENARELRRIFNNFVKSNQFTDNFVFDCRFAEKTVPVRVMMVRAFENSYPTGSDIVILDIRNGSY
jgi:hypothetical protein